MHILHTNTGTVAQWQQVSEYTCMYGDLVIEQSDLITGRNNQLYVCMYVCMYVRMYVNVRLWL